MKKIFLTLFLFAGIYKATLSQDVQLQGYAANDGLQINAIVQKSISKNNKLNFFHFSNLFTEYNFENTQAEMLNLVHYNLNKGLVVVGGFSLAKKDFIPSIGIGYALEKKDFNVNFFPMLNYSTSQKEVGVGVYSLFEYTPTIKGKWNFYSMLILDSDFSLDQHLESKQYIRLGLQHNNKIQFGLGLDFNQSIAENSNNSVGVFVGYTL